MLDLLEDVIATTDAKGADNDASFTVANLGAGEHRMDVANQWFARPDDQRFTSLPDLRAYTHRRHQAARTLSVRNHDFEVTAPDPDSYAQLSDQHRLAVRMPDGAEVQTSHWSFGQLASLAGAPAGYLRNLPGYLTAENINVGMRMNRKVETVKAFYQPDGEAQLHAVTGPDYGRIPDYEVVDAVMQIAGDGLGGQGWKVPGVMDWSTHRYDPLAPLTKDTTTLFASDRDVFLFLVDDLHPIEIGRLPNGDPDLMFRGFYVWNSEVGSKSLGIATMYLRAVCCNRILWGVENFSEISIRHSKHAPARFMYKAAPALRSFAQGDTKTIVEGVAAAKAAKVARNDDDALEFLKKRGFSKARSKAIVEAVEREEDRKPRTVWDFTQGITAVARTIPHQDDRVQVERVAKVMLDKVA